VCGAAAAALVVGTTLYERSHRPASGAATTAGTARGSDPVYRLRVEVPLQHVRDVRRRYAPEGQRALVFDVRRRIEGLGYESTITAMQDPTDNRIFSVLTRPRAGASPRDTDGVVRVVSREQIKTPPSIGKASAAGGTQAPEDLVEHVLGMLPVEPWLTPDERQALVLAMRSEWNTRHLKGLSSTFDPHAPVAASVLRAKATLLDPRRADPRSAEQRMSDLLRDLAGVRPGTREAERVRQLGDELRAYADRAGVPYDAVYDEVRHAAYAVAARGPQELLRSGISAFARPLGLALVRQLPHGAAIVDPHLTSLAMPETGKEAFVSPSALWLAHAAGKPTVSGVRDPDRIEEVYGSTETPNGSRDDMVRMVRARSMMRRAERTLNRVRWSTWYRRRAETE
jgi:hypothetical protein